MTVVKSPLHSKPLVGGYECNRLISGIEFRIASDVTADAISTSEVAIMTSGKLVGALRRLLL